MTEQLAIDFNPVRAARGSDPATSHAAARSAARWATSHAGRILDALQHGAATVDELSERTGLQSQQINKRLPELDRAGLARPTDVVRRSRSGHGERVWEAV